MQVRHPDYEKDKSPRTEYLKVHMTKEDKELLKKLASDAGRSMGNYIVQLIRKQAK